ncbi:MULTISPECIES: hypothetical protein [Enterobacteriaceae]|uniref:hypothetical protein n=1 Tax=Enterobacteriaceae TaxID=543 RepID=UPI000DFC92D6|nr:MULTISPECIES: hypothetical protein [Enterobacteriaceae]MBB2279440.1 hypothetical protein [Escherichia coli]MDW2646299.1 hypothetical protein [Citrobacter sp. HN-141]MDW2655848.1 hypothetical protein [Citrobacter sp. HN-120]MDW2698874.1 hypothetical protein [Citrobacter sp. HN-144]STM64709.1 Uncharacterised protein [Escherichia coli]
MDSKEPKISAGGMSNDELLAWMKNKTKAVEELKSALAHKEFLEEQLQINAAEIERLTPQACMNILLSDQDSIPH